MSKQLLYEWSQRDLGWHRPYSESHIEMWVLSPYSFLCYRLIHNEYTIDRECCLIDILVGSHHYIQRQELENLIPQDKPNFYFDGYNYMLDDGAIAIALMPRNGNKGFIFIPEDSKTGRRMLLGHKKLDSQDIFNKYCK